MTKEPATKESTEVEAYNLFDDGSDAPEVKELPFISIIHQAQLFELPDGTTAKEFNGIILHSYESNLWWAQSYDETGGGNMPDCFALERKKGQRMVPDTGCSNPQAQECGTSRNPLCPLNQFGSDGAGKACKNRRNCFVFLKQYSVPLWLQIPATSLKDYDKYLDTFPTKNPPLRFQQVMTLFKLEKKDNYSILKCSMIGEPNTNIESLRALKNTINKYISLMYLNVVQNVEK